MHTAIVFLLISRLTGLPAIPNQNPEFASYSDCQSAISELATSNPTVRHQLDCKPMKIIVSTCSTP